MSGGTNSIKSSSNAPSSQANPQASHLSESIRLNYQRVFGERLARPDPKGFLTSLDRIVQASGEIHAGQRTQFFRSIIEGVISHPSHPFSKLEADIRKDMIESLAGELAESHYLRRRKREGNSTPLV